MDDLTQLQLRIVMQDIFTVLPAPNERIVLFITCTDTVTQDSETYAMTIVARDISTPNRRCLSVRAPEGQFRPITLHKLFDAQSQNLRPFCHGHIYVGPKELTGDNAVIAIANGEVMNIEFPIVMAITHDGGVAGIELPIRFPAGRQVSYLWAPENAETLDAIKCIWTAGPPCKKKGGKSKKYKRRSLRRRRTR